MYGTDPTWNLGIETTAGKGCITNSTTICAEMCYTFHFQTYNQASNYT
jgi:hypothetical protein